MAAAVTSGFFPVKVHIKKHPELFEQFGAHWTPTQIVLDPDGVERHRIEGYLPVDDFIAQLGMGLGRVAFETGRYADAQRLFLEVWTKHPKASAAPEARYWDGVAAYKATQDSAKLAQTAVALRDMYPASEWARKSSVWLPQEAKQTP